MPQYLQLQLSNHSFAVSDATDYIASHCPNKAEAQAQETHGGEWAAVDTHVEFGITYQVVMRD